MMIFTRQMMLGDLSLAGSAFAQFFYNIIFTNRKISIPFQWKERIVPTHYEM